MIFLTNYPNLWNRLFCPASALFAVYFLALLPCSLQALPAWLFGSNLELASNGKTDYVILLSEQAIPAEQFAAEELSSHLEQICGVPFAIRREYDNPLASKAIYVGQTEFARSQGIDFSSLGVEEWVLRSKGNNLILSGGQPRGTLYAVYEFLEKELGCYWFDVHNQVIPKQPQLRLKAFRRQGKPAFPDRFIYTGQHGVDSDNLLRARNKDTKPKPAKLGFGYSIGTHTFWTYSNKFPEDKAEFLALNAAGKRPQSTSGHGPGQICLSHPGARASVLEQLRAHLAAEAAAVAASKEGREAAYAIGITQNDNHWICQCEGCSKLSREGQADSAALLDFINFLADNIKEEYPDALIETWAYANTSKPPVNVRPRDNVLIRVGQLNGEWAGDAIRAGNPNWLPEWFPDLFRPRNHPVNREATALLESWSKLSRHSGIWGYWVLYHEGFLSPWVNLRNLHQELRLLKKFKMERIFVENEITPLSSFYTLKTWAGWKLMQDPSMKLQDLLDIFMPGYYGPAAKPMLGYLNHLEDSIASVPAEYGNLSAMKTSQRPYLTLDFFRKSQFLLDAAEALTDADSRYSLNVQQERILVDSALVVMWKKLEKELPNGESMPWELEQVIDRYQQNYQRLIEQRDDIRGLISLKAVQESVQSLRQKSASFLLMEKDPPSLTVPRIAKAGGEPGKVAWEKAAPINLWVTKFGQEIPERKLRGALAHDGEFFYLLLEESGLDTGKLSPVWWGGDGWELFLSNHQNGPEYRQLALNSNGEYLVYEYQKGHKQIDIQAKLQSEKTADCWQTRLAIPLNNLLPETIQPGGECFLNIFRQTRFRPGEHLCWSPIFEAGYHDLERLGKIILAP